VAQSPTRTAPTVKIGGYFYSWGSAGNAQIKKKKIIQSNYTFQLRAIKIIYLRH